MAMECRNPYCTRRVSRSSNGICHSCQDGINLFRWLFSQDPEHTEGLTKNLSGDKTVEERLADLNLYAR